MNSKSVITSILRSEYPDEVELVGPTNLQDIVDGDVEFIEPEHGSSLDLATALTLLAAAVTFATAVLEAYAAFKNDSANEPSREELVVLISFDEDIADVLDEDDRGRLIDAVIWELRDSVE